MSDRIPRVFALRREKWDPYSGIQDGDGWDWVSVFYNRDGLETRERHWDWDSALERALLMSSNGPDGVLQGSG